MLHIVKPNEIDSVIGKDLGASESIQNRQNLFSVQQSLMDFFRYHLSLVSPSSKKLVWCLREQKWA